VKTNIPITIFIILAASHSRLIVHVVIIVFGVPPEWIVWVIYNCASIVSFARRTRRGLRRTHDSDSGRKTGDATIKGGSIMVGSRTSKLALSISLCPGSPFSLGTHLNLTFQTTFGIRPVPSANSQYIGKKRHGKTQPADNSKAVACTTGIRLSSSISSTANTSSLLVCSYKPRRQVQIPRWSFD
jgi:hypothetical protein